jgi:hypothetical protein
MARRSIKSIRAAIAETVASVASDMWTDEDGDLVFREGAAFITVSVDDTLEWPVVILSTVTNTNLPRIGALYRHASEHGFDREFTAMTVVTAPGAPTADVILGWELLAPDPDVLAWALGLFAGQANDIADEIHVLFGGDMPGTEVVADEEPEPRVALGRLPARERKKWAAHADHIATRLKRFLEKSEDFVIVEVAEKGNVYMQFAPTDDHAALRYEAVGPENLVGGEDVSATFVDWLSAHGWVEPGPTDGGNFHRYIDLPIDLDAVADDVVLTFAKAYGLTPDVRLEIRSEKGKATKS